MAQHADLFGGSPLLALHSNTQRAVRAPVQRLDGAGSTYISPLSYLPEPTTFNASINETEGQVAERSKARAWRAV